MATNDPICREQRNDRKEEDEHSDGSSKQIGGERKDRVSLSSKVNVPFRRLDKPLINILQVGLQEQKTLGGDTREKVGEFDMEVSAKNGGEAVEGTASQRNHAGRLGGRG